MDDSLLLPWLAFLASAAVIVLAGTKLSHFGDQLSDLTGLGGLWIGVVLMAAATSLPEVFTTISASLIGAPDIAAGDLFGAVMTNMLTLGIIDQIFRQKQVWRQAAFGHTLVAALAMVLVSLAGLFVLLKPDVTRVGLGIDTLILLILYVLGMRVVYRQEYFARQHEQAERVAAESLASEEDQRTHRLSRKQALRKASIGFGVSTIGILVSAPFLALSAELIAERSGVTETFIGTSLVALTTSMPELVTCLAAVRLGAFDLAVGNLFGSNAFNMAAFFFADLAYQDGSLLAAVEPAHALTAFWGIFLMNVGLMGIIYRAEKRYFLIEPDSFVMILGWIIGMWLLFR